MWCGLVWRHESLACFMRQRGLVLVGEYREGMPENSSKSYQIMKCSSKSNHRTCLNDGDVNRRAIGMTGNDKRTNFNTYEDCPSLLDAFVKVAALIFWIRPSWILAGLRMAVRHAVGSWICINIILLDYLTSTLTYYYYSLLYHFVSHQPQIWSYRRVAYFCAEQSAQDFSCGTSHLALTEVCHQQVAFAFSALTSAPEIADVFQSQSESEIFWEHKCN